MHDMRQIPCPMCGRRVTISENSPVPCPSCGVPVSAPTAEPPVAPILTDDDSATRVATIPPSEPAPAEAAPAVVAPAIPVAEPPTPPSAPLSSLSEVTDPRTQPASPAEVQQVAYPPATPAPAAVLAAEQAITQTYHATPTPQPETLPYTPIVPAAPQPAQPTSKRNPALLIVGAVVAVVILLGIIGAAVVFANHTIQQPTAQPTSTTAATATSAAPVGFIQFTDDGNVYKLNYPSDWKKTATSGDFSLTIFTGTPEKLPGVFEVEYFKIKVDPKTVQDTFFTALEKSGKVTNKQEPTSVSLAGGTWQRVTADVGTGSTTQHVVSLAANHGQYTLLIAYQAVQVAFDEADTHAFQPMLNSFQFVQ
ncbi:MAG TPA: hypothetical protein VF510_19710 [Ktedonobacterales bacterium]